MYQANGQPVLLSETESLRGDPVVPGLSVLAEPTRLVQLDLVVLDG